MENRESRTEVREGGSRLVVRKSAWLFGFVGECTVCFIPLHQAVDSCLALAEKINTRPIKIYRRSYLRAQAY